MSRPLSAALGRASATARAAAIRAPDDRRPLPVRDRAPAPAARRVASRSTGRSGRATGPTPAAGTGPGRAAPQPHARSELPANPHGHGFIAATSWNRAGKIVARPTRETATRPSSIGWRSASRTSRPNSGSSSRNRTPWSARVISPGDMFGPPPTIPAYEIVWCGDRNGGRRRSSAIGPSPAAEATTVAASAAASPSGGRSPGMVRARSVLPDPGGPMSRRPWPPASAISRPRRASS